MRSMVTSVSPSAINSMPRTRRLSCDEMERDRNQHTTMQRMIDPPITNVMASVLNSSAPRILAAVSPTSPFAAATRASRAEISGRNFALVSASDWSRSCLAVVSA